MSSQVRLRHLKMPRLRMRNQLIEADPTLEPFLDDDGQAKIVAPKTEGRRVLDTTMYEDELPEEEELNMELEHVKKERATLIKSLAALKADEGRSGAEMQAADIKILRAELAKKKEKLNELHQEAQHLRTEVATLEVTSRDCTALMPSGQPQATGKIAALNDAKSTRNSELVDADAKNQLYTLLAVRTRKEHEELAQRVAQARSMQEGFAEDLATMAGHAADVRAEREAAEATLSTVRHQFEGSRQDWKRKLHDRRKKVADIEKRKRDEADRESRRMQAAEDREHADKAKQATLRKQELAYEHQMLELQPQLQALENQWFSLHTLTGANTPEEVVTFWEELKAQEGQMRDLVRLAEERESRAKAAMGRLLESRSSVLQGPAEVVDDLVADAQEDTRHVDAEVSDGIHEEKLADALRRAATADKNYAKLRSVCVGARQGLTAVRARLEKALEEASAANRRNSGSGLGAAVMRRLGRSSSSQKNLGQRASGTGGRRESRPSAGAPAAEKQGEAFFPELPGLLEEVGDRLRQLMALDANLRATLAEKARPKGAPKPSVNAAALVRGLRRRSWTGPAWLGSITENGQAVPASLTMKRAKGKKRDTVAQPDLTRIYGWHSESDEEAEQDPAAKDAQAALDEGDDSAKVIDREFLKHRATKLAMKHRHDASGRGRIPAQVAAH